MSREWFVERECAVGGIACPAWAEWFQACEAADPRAIDQDRDPLELLGWPFNYQACKRPDVCPLAVRHTARAGNKIPAPQEENLMPFVYGSKVPEIETIGQLMVEAERVCFLPGTIAQRRGRSILGALQTIFKDFPRDLPISQVRHHFLDSAKMVTPGEELDLTIASDPIEPPRAIRYGRHPDRPPVTWPDPDKAPAWTAPKPELKTRDPGEVADRAIPLLREVVTIGGDRLSKRNQSLWVDLVQDALTFFDWLEHPDLEPGSKEDLEAAITEALELIAGNCEESEILRAALERARAAKG